MSRNREFCHPLAAAVFAAFATSVAGGCADGLVPELRSLNPWVREQWAADEREVATYHRKVADLAAVRSQAARLGPEEREPIASHLAAKLQEEKSPVLRVELVRTLGELNTETAQAAIVGSLSDESATVRVAACKALGKHPAQSGFQALAGAVQNDSDLDVRIAAARELGKFKGFAAPPALRPALDDRDPALQLAAMQSLENLTGRTELGNSATAWRELLDGGNPAPPPPPTLAEMVKRYWTWY